MWAALKSIVEEKCIHAIKRRGNEILSGEVCSSRHKHSHYAAPLRRTEEVNTLQQSGVDAALNSHTPAPSLGGVNLRSWHSGV